MQQAISIKLKSSFLTEAIYSEAKQVLIIVFKNGAKYGYKDVTVQKFNRLRNAKSKSSYFCKFIRNKYVTKKIEVN